MNEQKSVFTDQDLTIEEYRSFSAVSLILFIPAVILSLVIAVNKYMIPLGLILAGVTFAYVIYLGLAKRNYIGTILAKMALFLLLFSVTASYQYHQSRLKHLSQVAIEFAEDYFEVVKENRMHEAYQLTLGYDFRVAPGTNLIREYGTLEEPGDEMTLYLKQYPERLIRVDGDKAKLQRVAINYRRPKPIRETFTIRYIYDPADGSEQRIFDIGMMRLNYPSPPGPQWYVEGIANIRPRTQRSMTKPQLGTPPSPDDM